MNIYKFIIGSILLLFTTTDVIAQETQAKEFSVNEAITYALENSFEVHLAKLDFLMNETDIQISEAIFDTFLYGEYSYSEDNLQTASDVTGAEGLQTNYNAQINKKLVTGTDVSLGYSHNRNWTDSAFVSVNPANEDTLYVDAKQPMMQNVLGYLDRRKLTITKLAVDNAGLDEKDKIEDLIAEVEKAYWQAAARQETVRILDDMLKKAEELHAVNEKNYDVGRIEKVDFIASKANVLGRRNDLEKEKVTLKNSLATLKRLMNFDDSMDIMVRDKLIHKTPHVTFEECLKVAIDNRRDYKKAKTDVKIKEVTLQMKSNERWPEVDLIGSLKMNGINSNLSSMTKMVEDNSNTYYYVGVEVNVPIENNDALGNYKKAQYGKEHALVWIKDVERKIITEVGNAYRDYMLYNILVEQLIEVSTLQKQKLEEQTKQFDYGRSSTKDVIDYQREYLLAQIEVVLGMYNYEQSRVELEKQLNILLDRYEVFL
ncbi:MAG: TolC family protein [Candidatus Omnitrophica bacterium]|nr:TolC family protein [Candidatus Omnitrophota bacterium]